MIFLIVYSTTYYNFYEGTMQYNGRAIAVVESDRLFLQDILGLHKAHRITLQQSYVSSCTLQRNDEVRSETGVIRIARPLGSNRQGIEFF
jgi:hypothetical protein